MGGSNSKNSIFDKYPKDYKDIPRQGCDVVKEKSKCWFNRRIGVDEYSTIVRIKARREFSKNRVYEFIYQIIMINKHRLRRKIIHRGVETMPGHFFLKFLLDKKIYNIRCEPCYNQFNFQTVAYAIIEDNGLRKLNFEDENVYGKSTTVLASGESLEVPVQFITLRAPLLAKYIDEKKPNPKLKCSEEFFQVFYGVHVPLKVEELRSLLKFSVKFQVLNVKKYCEQKLIRRKYLNISEKRKFKMACEFNLNILMNQVLRNVKNMKELAKLASIAIEMESMESNISKLLIARMYKIALPLKQ